MEGERLVPGSRSRAWRRLRWQSCCRSRRSPASAVPVEMADLVDPDGVNPQRLVDVMNDLQAEVEMGTCKARAGQSGTRRSCWTSTSRSSSTRRH